MDEKEKYNFDIEYADLDAPIFKYIYPKSDDKVSDMKTKDLQELIYLINNYNLGLRELLNYNENVTFGFELEYERSSYVAIKDQMKKHKELEDWDMHDDGSLDMGGEISSPILIDTNINWINLNKVCEIVGRNAVIGKKAGGHIHIGTQVLGEEKKSWLNFIKLWSVYENVIFRFLYGEYLSGRSTIDKFAEPIAEMLKDVYSTYKKKYGVRDLITDCSLVRYQAINFDNIDKENLSKMKEGNTIEFRCPNGTLNPVIWQNNLNLLVNILNYSKSSKYNKNIIINREKKIKGIIGDINFYGEIFLDQTLEFADMIYNNNLDKVYFLRQYLKSFEYEEQEYTKAKKFTR